MFEELPAGVGYADIVYLPKKDSILPALIAELKWNQSAESALEQIRDRRYPAAVREYGSTILLVGISYDREAPAGKRKHRCRIEKYENLTNFGEGDTIIINNLSDNEVSLNLPDNSKGPKPHGVVVPGPERNFNGRNLSEILG